jgi:hypothetical protein
MNHQPKPTNDARGKLHSEMGLRPIWSKDTIVIPRTTVATGNGARLKSLSKQAEPCPGYHIKGLQKQNSTLLHRTTEQKLNQPQMPVLRSSAYKVENCQLLLDASKIESEPAINDCINNR